MHREQDTVPKKWSCFSQHKLKKRERAQRTKLQTQTHTYTHQYRQTIKFKRGVCTGCVHKDCYLYRKQNCSPVNMLHSAHTAVSHIRNFTSVLTGIQRQWTVNTPLFCPKKNKQFISIKDQSTNPKAYHTKIEKQSSQNMNRYIQISPWIGFLKLEMSTITCFDMNRSSNV